MKFTFAIFMILIINSISANAQEAQCPEGQLYGCGAFYTQLFPPITRTICGCFNEPEQPIDRGSRSLKSCSNECLFDGFRTDSGCSCLPGPIVIPTRETPEFEFSEFKELQKLKQKSPELYDIYIDTQINGNRSKPPLTIDEFRALFK